VEYVTAQQLDLRAMLATHGHHDHVSAAAELLQEYRIPFCLHSRDTSILKRLNLSRYAFHGLEPVSVPGVEIDLAEKSYLHFGSLRVTTVHAPGHSPGSVCFGIGAVVFTGDTLMETGPGRTDLLGGSSEALEESVAMLSRQYGPSTILYPGHGGSVRLGDAVTPWSSGEPAQELAP